MRAARCGSTRSTSAEARRRAWTPPICGGCSRRSTVTCGSTSGIKADTNLYQIFQQQLRIFGSFGSSVRNVADSLDKMAAGMTPVIDTEIGLEEFPVALDRLKTREVFGKIVATVP